jgi:predicted MFS family arabinose efflux permease
VTDLDTQQTIEILERSGHESVFYESIGRADPGEVRSIPAPVRPLAVLALLNACADAAFLPLLPAIRDDFGLSGAETGSLLAATTFAALVATMPLSALAARVGARPVLLAAAALMPLSLLAMAAAPGLPWLLAGRILFGLSFAVTWSIAPGVASARVPGAAGTASLLAVSGLGWLVGPVASGALASVAGWRIPLVAAAVASAPAVLPFLRPAPREATEPAVRLGALLALVRTSPAVRWSAAVAALLGIVTGAIGVLVPTLLADNGVGPAGVGLAVTVSAVVWVGAAAGSGHIRGSRIGVRTVGATVAVLAVAWALPVASLSTVTLVGFLVVAAACRAPLGALIYPLASRGVSGERGATAIAGLLNIVWAVAALGAPVLAGAAVQAGLERAAFGAVCLAAATLAVGMLATSRPVATA